jgi:hypothetical protein
MTMPVALGDPPTPNERRETGRLAISIVELVRRGDASQLHLLLQSMTVRELALTLGSFGSLVNAMGDQLDSVCTGQGIPVMATDCLRQWYGSMVQVARAPHDGQMHD